MSDDARTRSERIGDRMIALFLLGAVATGPPILGLVAAPVYVFGIPLLFAWLFGVWVLIIALLAHSVDRRRRLGGEPPQED